MSDPLFAFVVLCIFAVGPLLVGWHRQIWSWMKPQLSGTLGRPGRHVAEHSTRSPILWSAPGGPLIAILATADRWAGTEQPGSDASSSIIGENIALTSIGFAIYIVGLVGLIVSGRRKPFAWCSSSMVRDIYRRSPARRRAGRRWVPIRVNNFANFNPLGFRCV